MAFIMPLVKKDYAIYAHRSTQQPSVGRKQRDRSLSMPISTKENNASLVTKEMSPTSSSQALSSPKTCSPTSIPTPLKRGSGIRTRLKSERFHSSNLPATIEEEETATEDEFAIQEASTNTSISGPKYDENNEKKHTIKSLHANSPLKEKKPKNEKLQRLRTISSPPDMMKSEQHNCSNLLYSTIENDYYPLIPIINPISLDCRLREPKSLSKKFNVVFRLIRLCSPKKLA